ncbi:retrovirus-related pol polyprotein from transposon TNT 1-94 [Tanacetum coccineum]
MAAYAFAAAEEEDTHEPLTYQEAVACEDSSKWKAAMEEEMDSLRKNKTWELVDPPAGQKLVSSKWLYKIKEGIEGVQKPRYKARLVARGFTQRAGIDYNEVFSPVVRHTSIRVILALTACKDYELEQLDVKTAFLHGNLEEVIYMRQPPGYEQGNKVCLLKKSLYGLKQSPRQWYRRFDEYMLSNGFKRSSYDSCVYYRSYAPGEYIYLLLYVDDMLIACKSKAEIGSTKSLLKKEFDMKELGEAKKILGMEIVRDRSRKILRVSQSGYISKILNNFRIDNGKSVQMPLGGHFKLSLKDCPVRDCDVERMSKVPYANAVGSLMYLMVCTRPDIAYAVSVVSRYLANPGKNHWEAVKWILKYLRGTKNVGLMYDTGHGDHVDVTGFVDSDYAKDPDKGKSITGYAFLVQRCVVSRKATLQHVVDLSTTEAEYMALTEAVKEAIWLSGLLEELGVELNTVAVNCDNQGAIHLSRNHVFHEMTKHINVRYHFIIEVLEAKTVKVLKVGLDHNAAIGLNSGWGYGVVRPTLGGVNSKVLILGVVYFVASEALELVENLGNINDFSGKTKLYLVLPVAFLDSWFILWIFSSFGEASEVMRRSIVKLEVYRKFTNTLALFVLLSIAWIDYESLLAYSLLVVICILWAPSRNPTRYAYEGDTGDNYDEEAISLTTGVKVNGGEVRMVVERKEKKGLGLTDHLIGLTEDLAEDKR